MRIISLASRGLFLAGQSIPLTIVTFYGECMKMCEDSAPNFGDKRTVCCVTTHRLVPPFSSGNFRPRITWLSSPSHPQHSPDLASEASLPIHFDTTEVIKAEAQAVPNIFTMPVVSGHKVSFWPDGSTITIAVEWSTNNCSNFNLLASMKNAVFWATLNLHYLLQSALTAFTAFFPTDVVTTKSVIFHGNALVVNKHHIQCCRNVFQLLPRNNRSVAMAKYYGDSSAFWVLTFYWLWYTAAKCSPKRSSGAWIVFS
jgi:hypothetical protein